MIVIKGTDKIKGVLDLNDVGLQIKAGDTFSLSGDQFYKHGVQVALKMKFITYTNNNVPDPESDTIVELRNIYDRSITINAIDSDVRPGQTFGISEELINNADIQGALAKGMLEIVSTIRSSESDMESDIEIGGLFDEAIPGPIPPIREEASILEYKTDDDMLETNDELNSPNVIEEEPANIIDNEDPDPVTKLDVPDPKKKSVVWNPNKDPIPHTRNKMDSVGARKGEIGEVDPLIESDVNLGDEISFVDNEQDKQKQESHPILKDKPQKDNNDELDFI